MSDVTFQTKKYPIIGLNTTDADITFGDLGDFNGDSYGDFYVLSIRTVWEPSYAHLLYPFVIYGDKDGYPEGLNFSNLGKGGFLIDASFMDYVSLQSLGDVNGDGIKDLGILARTGRDENWVLYGNPKGYTGTISLSENEKTGVYLGSNAELSTTADFNGDGINDFFMQGLGRPYAPYKEYEFTLMTYVVFGTKEPRESFDVMDINSSNGVIINVVNGTRATSAELYLQAVDANGDGFMDMFISDYNNGNGIIDVVYGKKSFSQLPFSVSEINGENGFVINGNNQHAISSVSNLLDINGDGVDDFSIISNMRSYQNKESIVMFGNKHGFQLGFDINSLDGTNGFYINGGFGVFFGQCNGNVLSSILVNGLSPSSADIVFFGQNSWPSDISADSLDGNPGIVISDNLDPNEHCIAIGRAPMFGGVTPDLVYINKDQNTFYAVGNSNSVFPSTTKHTTTSTTTTPMHDPTTAHDSDGEGGTNVAVIAGATVGGGVAVLAVGAILWYGLIHHGGLLGCHKGGHHYSELSQVEDF